MLKTILGALAALKKQPYLKILIWEIVLLSSEAMVSNGFLRLKLGAHGVGERKVVRCILYWFYRNIISMKTKSLICLLVAALMVLGAATVIVSPAYAARSYYSTYRKPGYRNYSNGGSLYYQRGYLKSNGSYVQPHLKTRPDNTIYNNRKFRLGF